MASRSKTLFSASVEFRGKSRCLRLTKEALLLETSSSDTPNGLSLQCILSVPTNEIITVHPCRTDFPVDHTKDNIELHARSGTTAFTCHVIKRVHKHRWRDQQLTFHCQEANTCEHFIKHITGILSDFPRPKSLQVFINPFGGRQKGPKIYETKVAPLFQMAGIKVQVIMTEKAGHARELIISDPDIDKTDGLVCVGGDGMYGEVLNGLLTRTQRQHGVRQDLPRSRLVVPKLRIGIIPAGSTDAVVYGTVGTNDPITSALHIIIGDSLPIDVTAVHHQDKLVSYCSSLLAYGFYGDAMVDSEQHRWMGPKRYDFSGFKKFIKNQSYEGELSFVEDESGNGSLSDNDKCRMGCQVCQTAGERLQKLQEAGDRQDTLASEKWQTIRGNFLAINAVTMSCACGKTPEGVSAGAHVGDGCADLIVVRQTSRFNYMRHLWRTATNNDNPLDMSFVQAHRVKAFCFRPQTQHSQNGNHLSAAQQRSAPHTSVWNCDGEILSEPSIDVIVHCQLVRIFARGPEDEEKTMCCRVTAGSPSNSQYNFSSRPI